MTNICILTPDEAYEEKWQAEAAPLKSLFGQMLTFRDWTDAGKLAGFDLILPLLAWGYHRKTAQWYGLLDQWEAAELPFANLVPLLRWNTDKDYLLDLEAAGVSIVPTIEVGRIGADDLAEARARFGCEELVIKPAISGGADGTYKLGTKDPVPFDVLEREMLIQPVMPAIAEEGEYSLFYFDATFSHAILKKPATGDFRVQEQFGGRDVSVEAYAEAKKAAEKAIAASPHSPLYARIDLVRDQQGMFRLMELEVIEPSLFLHHAPDAGEMFRAAVLKRMG